MGVGSVEGSGSASGEDHQRWIDVSKPTRRLFCRARTDAKGGIETEVVMRWGIEGFG